MNVKLNGNRNVRVYFQHTAQKDVDLDSLSGRTTKCSLVEYPNGFDDDTNTVELGKGQASVSLRPDPETGKTDIFNKNTGRKIALTRALNNSEFNKNERTQVWNVYHKMQNNHQFVKLV
jgi:hypothetical protein